LKLLFLVDVEPVSKNVRVFADHISDSALLVEFFLPLFDTVGGLFLLQPAEDGLVLDCDLDELLAPLLAVETLLGDVVLAVALALLHDVGHLFEQNPVFTFDFGVSLCIPISLKSANLRSISASFFPFLFSVAVWPKGALWYCSRIVDLTDLSFFLCIWSCSCFHFLSSSLDGPLTIERPLIAQI
jgi:hypothetical protein